MPSLSRRDLIASICRDSYFSFVKEFWSVVSQEKPHWNWHIEYICDRIQEKLERVFKGLPKDKDMVCNISPGTSKSTVFSIMLTPWAWSRMPSCRVINISYNSDLSLDFSRKSRDIIKSEKYQDCFKGITIRDDQDTKARFVNTKGGDRSASGLTGGIMGFHGHVIVVDDPLDPMQAMSDADIKATNYFMTETIPTRKVDKEVAVTLLVMQRLAEADPSGERIARKDEDPVDHICLPAEIYPDSQHNVNPPDLIEYYVDGLMDPKRLSRKSLREVEKTLGPLGFAGQFLQNPVPRGGGMFHTDKFKDERNPPKNLVDVVRYWDKAATQSAGCYTVGIKMGKDADGYYWVLDVVRGQWDSHRREKKILETARLDGLGVPIGLEQEPGSGGKDSAGDTVRRLAGFNVKIHKVGKSDGDKELRADGFSTQVNAGNVYLIKADWNAAYINELMHFPMSKYKDQVDASSGAFFFLAQPKIVIGAMW